MPSSPRALRRSTVTEDGGWVWLDSARGNSMLQFAVRSVVVSVLLVAAAAAATLPPPAVAVPLLAAALAGTGLVGGRLWRSAHERVGVSAMGVMVQAGVSVTQLTWSAITEVRGVPVRGGVRVVVATREERRATRTAFAAEAAREWLAHCLRQARVRQLDPQPTHDGLGFTAAG